MSDDQRFEIDSGETVIELGTSRLRYCLTTSAFTFVALSLVGLLNPVNELGRPLSDDGFFMTIVVLVAAATAVALLTVSRFRNAAVSCWWALLIYVPFIQVLIWAAGVALPTNYGGTKQRDWWQLTVALILGASLIGIWVLAISTARI
ncbi:MAG: hypothetical protein V4689_15405 [Verrucomicrobiota bacterium]